MNLIKGKHWWNRSTFEMNESGYFTYKLGKYYGLDLGFCLGLFIITIIFGCLYLYFN